jgi:hypothetical protein
LQPPSISKITPTAKRLRKSLSPCKRLPCKPKRIFKKTSQLNENKIVDIPKDVKTELKFWSNCIHSAEKGFPIPDLTEDAPFFATEIFFRRCGSRFFKLKIHRRRPRRSSNCFKQKQKNVFHFKNYMAKKFSHQICSQLAHPGNNRNSSTISDQSQIFC